MEGADESTELCVALSLRYDSSNVTVKTVCKQSLLDDLVIIAIKSIKLLSPSMSKY